jgi:zinc transport system substrate-binding protein
MSWQVLSGVLLVLCTLVPRSAEPRRLKVLTSFLPVYCFTVNVAGDHADAENLMSGNASPHDYQFSRPEIDKVNAADLIVVNGLGVEVEAKLEKLLKASGKAQRKIELSAGLGQQLIKSAEHAAHDHGSINPHIWLDPVLATHCVSNVLRGLQAADPANAKAYAQNAEKYLARLSQLHRDLEAGLAFAKGTPIVTHHDAFAYFARRYQLRVVGVVEEVAELSASARHLASLSRIIQAQHVPVIFAEPNSSLKQVRQLAEDLKVSVALLDTLENGQPRPQVYEDAMRANLKTIQKELSGYASARTP